MFDKSVTRINQSLIDLFFVDYQPFVGYLKRVWPPLTRFPFTRVWEIRVVFLERLPTKADEHSLLYRASSYPSKYSKLVIY